MVSWPVMDSINDDIRPFLLVHWPLRGYHISSQYVDMFFVVCPSILSLWCQTATEWYSLYFRYSRGDGHQQQPQQKRPLEEEGYENVDLNGRSQSITTVATRPSSFWSPQTQVSVSANEGRFFLAGEGLSDVSLATTDGFGSISDHVSGDNNARISSWIRCGLIGRVVQNLRKKFNMSGLVKHLLLGAFMLGVATQGTISCFETLGAEYAMTKFDLTSAEAGSIFATCGAVGVLVVFATGILSRYWNGVELIIGGVALMIVTCLVLVSSPTGASGLRVFQGAVFLTYSVGYPAGHTAVRLMSGKRDRSRVGATLNAVSAKDGPPLLFDSC